MYSDSKKDVDEPAHPIGWKDNLPEEKQSMVNLLDDIFSTEEEACDSCAI